MSYSPDGLGSLFAPEPGLEVGQPAPVTSPGPASNAPSSAATAAAYTFYQVGFWDEFWKSFATKTVEFISNLIVGFVLAASLVLFISYILAPIIKKILQKTKVSKTTTAFITTGVSNGLKIIVTLVFIDLVAAGLITLTTFIAALGIGLGQGLANIAQNFISGVMIISQDMFVIGDWIDCGDTISGEIVKIGITHTVLKAMDNTCIIVQNSQLTTVSSGIWNYNGPQMRVDVGLLIRHNEDVELVKQMFLAVCAKDERILASPIPFLIVQEIQSDGLMLSLRCFTNNDVYWDVWYDMPELIMRGCRALGVIPQVSRQELEMPGLESDIRTLSAEVAALRKLVVARRPVAKRKPRKRLHKKHVAKDEKGGGGDDDNDSKQQLSDTHLKKDGADNGSGDGEEGDNDVNDKHQLDGDAEQEEQDTNTAPDSQQGSFVTPLLDSDDGDADDSNESKASGVMRAGERRRASNDFDEFDDELLMRHEAPLHSYRIAKVSPKDRYKLQQLQADWKALSTSVTAEAARHEKLEESRGSLIARVKRRWYGVKDTPDTVDAELARRRHELVDEVPKTLRRRKRRVRRREHEFQEAQEHQEQALL